MIRSSRVDTPLWEGIPRESGDDPTLEAFGVTPEEYSPRERG